MGRYRIWLRTSFWTFDIDDIEAKDENDAFNKAYEIAIAEINCAKLDEVYEY